MPETTEQSKETVKEDYQLKMAAQDMLSTIATITQLKAMFCH